MRRKTQNVTITVSIVDDDEAARRILTDWLRHEQGFRCLGDYGSVEEALPRIPDEKPGVVLMDINLPGLSGIECVRRLKPLLPATQFLMLTVYKDDDNIFSALAAGASGYLLKRTSREELFTAIRSVYAGGSPMTSNIARKVVQHFQALPASPSARIDGLSPRESEVLELLAHGRMYKEIANTLNISIETVGTYTRRIYEKLQVHSRSQAVARYAQRRPAAPSRTG